MIKKIQQAPEDVKRVIKTFYKDYVRVFRASKSTAVLLFISFGFLGFWPALELMVAGNLINAITGARVIQTLTSDVQKFMWQQVILLIATIPPFYFAGQVKGVVRKLGWQTAELFFVAAIFFAALPVAPILLFLILVSGLAMTYVTNKYGRLAYSFAVLLLTTLQFATMINVTVHRGAHLEEFILWAGALMVFAFWFALRPYIDYENNH